MPQLPNKPISGPTNKIHPELSWQAPKRKYGRQDYSRFDNICFESASIGGASLGKVDIDVELRFAKSKWGFLHGHTPAGILFVDVDIHQRANCKLEWARVKVVLRDKEPNMPSKYPTQMTHFFGPKHLTGTESLEHKESNLQFQPSAEFMGTGVSGLGASFSSKVEKVHRWDIRGQRILCRPAAGILGLHYNALEWEMTENKLESRRGNRICTAFAFTHSGNEILMDVIVEGRLSSKMDRLCGKAKKLKFRPDAGRKPGQISTTLIGVFSGERPSLDMLAAGLENAMLLENLVSQPAEIPKPQQSTFHSGIAEPSPNTSAMSASAEELEKGEVLESQQPQLLPESVLAGSPPGNPQQLDPIVQRLLCAGQSLARSPGELLLEEWSRAWDEDEAPSRSLSPTLVEGGKAAEALKDELTKEPDPLRQSLVVDDRERTPPHHPTSKVEPIGAPKDGLPKGRLVSKDHLNILGAFVVGLAISYIVVTRTRR